MSVIVKNMTFEKYTKIKKILMEQSPFVLNDIEIGINTDRNDSCIFKSMKETLIQTEQICNILNISIEELNSVMDYEQSDHEVVYHKIDMNPTREVDSYCLYKNKLCLIENIEEGVFYIEDIKTNEQFTVGMDYITIPNWDDIFMIRDNVKVY